MILQSCCSNPTKNLNTFCYYNVNRKAKTRQSFYYLKSLSKNKAFKTDSAELDAAKVSRTTSEYDDIIWPSPNDEIPFWKKEFPSWDISSEGPIEVQKDSDLMHVVHVTAEMAPIAKVGGLGDVVTGLARACISRGHKVDVFIPFYECINKKRIKDLALISTYSSYHDGNWIPTNIYRGVVSGIPTLFIEPANHFFKGQSVYGGSYNELEAYLFFSRACLEWLQVSGTQPDIVHVHEWQTCGVPLLYWDMYHYLSLKKPRIVLTIHNMEHYGECRLEPIWEMWEVKEDTVQNWVPSCERVQVRAHIRNQDVFEHSVLRKSMSEATECHHFV